MGVKEFINKALQQDNYHKDGGIQCPCMKCDLILEYRIVKVHLYKHGFKPNYWVWIDHGEKMPQDDLHNDHSCIAMGRDVEDEQFTFMQDMVYDALRQQESFQPSNLDIIEEAPNEETQIS